VYAGAPAAVEAFRSAREVFAELGLSVPDDEA
jgi:4-carboxymuconolactone decarboxylase